MCTLGHQRETDSQAQQSTTTEDTASSDHAQPQHVGSEDELQASFYNGRKVLELDLSLAIALKHITYKEIITATKSTAYRLDQNSANALSFGVNVKAKPPRSNLPFQQHKTLCSSKRTPTLSQSLQTRAKQLWLWTNWITIAKWWEPLMLTSIGSQYLVATEHKPYFSDDSALLSMISLFSSFDCFNLSYPASLKPYYYFLEQYIFKVTPSMPPPAIVTRVLSTFKDL